MSNKTIELNICGRLCKDLVLNIFHITFIDFLYLLLYLKGSEYLSQKI